MRWRTEIGLAVCRGGVTRDILNSSGKGKLICTNFLIHISAAVDLTTGRRGRNLGWSGLGRGQQTVGECVQILVRDII